MKYSATLKTAAALSCAALTGPGETLTGSAKYAWLPKAKGSTGTVSFPLTSTAASPQSGAITSGTYAPLTFAGTVSEVFTGAATCATKAVVAAKFTGSAVSFK